MLKRWVDHRVETSEINETELLIGRGPAMHLRLEDEELGSLHASITQQAGRFILTDQQSPTGTYVNGKRIDKVFLNDGDRIAIGTFLLWVHYSASPPSLCLETESIMPKGTAAASDAKPPRVNYAAAYSLSRGFLNKTVLNLLLVSIALVAVSGVLLAGRRDVFRPGPVSDAHMLIADQCSQCHVAFQGPSEQACETCHKGPQHHANQVSNPSCLSCHIEHRGASRLVQVDNRQCVSCHARLETRDPRNNKIKLPSVFAARVTDFVGDHPQFSVSKMDGKTEERIRMNENGIRRLEIDVDLNHKVQGQISLNHRKHLEKTLVGQRRPLTCGDCHQPAADGKRMISIKYATHCSNCHDVELLVPDKQYSDCRVPHGSVEKVHEYLLGVYADGRCKVQSGNEPEHNLLFAPPRPVLSTSVAERLKQTENFLFFAKGTKCALCHKLKSLQQKPLPDVEDAFVPGTWFRHASFRHKAHRMLDCVECHVEIDPGKKDAYGDRITARTSENTTDILVPGIDACRTCHSRPADGNTLREASAPTSCASCHSYHDKRKDHEWNFKKTLGDFRLSRITSPDDKGQ